MIYQNHTASIWQSLTDPMGSVRGTTQSPVFMALNCHPLSGSAAEFTCQTTASLIHGVTSVADSHLPALQWPLSQREFS